MVTDCRVCPLRKAKTFRDMGADELKFMRSFKVGESVLGAGAPILMEGSNSPQLFTVLRGMGIRYKLLEDGQRQVLNFVLPGDFIGLQAGVMGEMKHSVEATTAITLCVFNRSELWTMFRQQPQRSYDLTWIASVEEHFLGDALAAVGQMSAVQRISWGLSRFFDRCEGLGLVSSNSCPFPYRQQDLADACGLSLVHTNKTLQKLRSQQILSVQDGWLRLFDREKAQDISMSDDVAPSARPLM